MAAILSASSRASSSCWSYLRRLASSFLRARLSAFSYATCSATGSLTLQASRSAKSILITIGPVSHSVGGLNDESTTLVLSLKLYLFSSNSSSLAYLFMRFKFS